MAEVRQHANEFSNAKQGAEEGIWDSADLAGQKYRLGR
jgi:hypothetical protein